MLSACVHTGKWHLGLSCASRGDHCSHPRNHGFEFFYGLPLGVLRDCKPGSTPELHRGLTIALWVCTVVLGLVPLVLLIPNLAGWFRVPWTLLILLFLLEPVFFIGWYSSYGFVRRWNCIVMRDHDIMQQPMKEDGVSSLLLREALGFMDR